MSCNSKKSEEKKAKNDLLMNYDLENNNFNIQNDPFNLLFENTKEKSPYSPNFSFGSIKKQANKNEDIKKKYKIVKDKKSIEKDQKRIKKPSIEYKLKEKENNKKKQSNFDQISNLIFLLNLEYFDKNNFKDNIIRTEEDLSGSNVLFESEDLYAKNDNKLIKKRPSNKDYKSDRNQNNKKNNLRKKEKSKTFLNYSDEKLGVIFLKDSNTHNIKKNSIIIKNDNDEIKKNIKNSNFNKKNKQKIFQLKYNKDYEDEILYNKKPKKNNKKLAQSCRPGNNLDLDNNLRFLKNGKKRLKKIRSKQEPKFKKNVLARYHKSVEDEMNIARKSKNGLTFITPKLITKDMIKNVIVFLYIGLFS